MQLTTGSTFRIAGIVAALGTLLLATSASVAGPTDLPLPKGCTLSNPETALPTSSISEKPAFPPAQLEVRTPFEPTVIPSGGRSYLFYELHLHNYSDSTVVLRGIKVVNADDAKQQVVAELSAEELSDRLIPISRDKPGDNRLGARQGAVAIICLAFDRSNQVPGKLRHRVLLENAIAEGPAIGSNHTTLHMLGRPVAGSDWVADSSPSLDSHHRTVLIVAGGLAQISRRYAIDWKIIKQGASYSGDARDVRSYYAYGKNVLAVADATVLLAKDGLPDNIPLTEAGFSPAVPITMETIAGNSIVLDLGGGQFATYAHLEAGTLRVKAGDHVRRGEPLARIGSSGDAREPHLHFQVTTAPDLIASEGLPYLVDNYRAKVADGEWQKRTQEFPLGDIVIDFGTETVR